MDRDGRGDSKFSPLPSLAMSLSNNREASKPICAFWRDSDECMGGLWEEPGQLQELGIIYIYS
ncbi:hypothetical protein CCACVL1_15007 [Corchorus capsularis]|uniref:Uncharacterized protein n=1 Tax=Corchorus capsularis TaxID=210143 RepID=A0A1R3I4J5_COCAP|nr:hypothetical protein CCACVL1_15007 [Corchorus capsularis]